MLIVSVSSVCDAASSEACETSADLLSVVSVAAVFPPTPQAARLAVIAAEMEQELDVSLFNRSTRKVTLTEAGLLLLPYARKAVELQREYTAALTDYQKRIRSSLSIGIAFRYRETNIYDYISSFQDQNPDISLHVFNYESEQLEEMVESGICDCIFVREDIQQAGSLGSPLQRIHCAVDYLRIHLPASHPLAGQEKIQLKDLKHENFLMANDTALSYVVGLEACHQAGFTPNILFQGNRPQILNCLCKGLGVSLMFGDYNNNPAFQDIISLDLEPAAYAHLNLVYRTDNRKQALQRFIELVKANPLKVITIK